MSVGILKYHEKIDEKSFRKNQRCLIRSKKNSDFTNWFKLKRI